MRYEVIGWTDSETSEYPLHKHITAPVDAAIIKEIRKHGYLFGGDFHEQCCPVLNDGTYVSYSWRGWGRIMALAHGLEEKDYMIAYMDELINPEMRKYPKIDVLDDSRIVLKESLTDTHIMPLSEEMSIAIKEGTKTVEVRLFNEESKRIDIGDYIEFIRENKEEVIKVRVCNLVIRESFKELFERDIDFKNTELRFTPEQLGAPTNSTVDSLIKGMYQCYTEEQEKKYGVIAFILELV